MSNTLSNPIPEFRKFRSAVRIRVRELCGMDPEDLCDFPYWDAFEDGFTIEETAEAILDENGFDFSWLGGD